MAYCICNLSAHEVLRSSGRLLPDLLRKSRTARLEGCRLASCRSLGEDLERLGVRSMPYHLLVGSHRALHATEGVVAHRTEIVLPRNALIRIDGRFLVTGPEMLFCDLAGNSDLSDVELAARGYELCGTYVVDQSWDGLTVTSQTPTTTDKIARFIDATPGRKGNKRARRIIGHVHDRSHSPMETVLAMLFTFPRSRGGWGIPGAVMNYAMRTNTGLRYIDLAFPQLKVGFEYKGKQYHSIEQAGRDDRRQNTISSRGFTILNVWYEDVARSHLFDQLSRNFARAARVRLRVRDSSFARRQQLLRLELMPAIERFADFGA